MASVAFVSRFPSINALVSLAPNKPIDADAIKEFLTSNAIEVEFVTPLPENGFVVKAKAATTALVMPSGMILACIPGTQELLVMAPQVIELFYRPAPAAPTQEAAPSVSDAGEIGG